jgi:hypothetical protein
MLYFYGAILVIIAGLSLTCWALYNKAELAEQRYETVVKVNENNTKVMKELREAQAFDRALTQKELEATQKRAAPIEKIKQEIGNASDAQEPAGATFDELSRRLRALNSGATD